jgi:hypothetical protein
MKTKVEEELQKLSKSVWAEHQQTGNKIRKCLASIRIELNRFNATRNGPFSLEFSLLQ